MKRLLVSALSVLLLLGSIPFFMIAAEPEEGETDTSSTTVTEDTQPSTSDSTATTPSESEPTDPTETGENTTGSTTGTTVSPQPTFDFVEQKREYDSQTKILSVTWNYADNADYDVVAVVAGDHRLSVKGSGGFFEVDLSKLSPGEYELGYILQSMTDGMEYLQPADTVVVAGKHTLKIDLQVNDVFLKVTLLDTNDDPVPNYPLVLTLNGVQKNATTNEKGEYSYRASDTLKKVTCVAPSREMGSVAYAGATASWEEMGSTQTTREDWEPEFPTVTYTRWSATKLPIKTEKPQTYATIKGAGTTSMVDSLVALNASFDEGVVMSFGLQNDDFHQKARLLVSPELYTSLVGNNKATVMMTLSHNGFQITDQHISQAVWGRSDYSPYTEIKRVALTLGLQFVDENKNTTAIPVAPTGTYRVRIPVPEEMAKSNKLAIAVVGDTSLSQLTEAKVQNGYMEFETNAFTSIAILGFGYAETTTGGGFPWGYTLLILIGLVMIAGALLLLYFFVWRKPVPLPAEGAEVDVKPAEEPSAVVTASPTAEEILEELAPVQEINPDVFVVDPLPQDAPVPVEIKQDLYSQAPETEECIDLYSSNDRQPHA